MDKKREAQLEVIGMGALECITGILCQKGLILDKWKIEKLEKKLPKAVLIRMAKYLREHDNDLGHYDTIEEAKKSGDDYLDGCIRAWIETAFLLLLEEVILPKDWVKSIVPSLILKANQIINKHVEKT